MGLVFGQGLVSWCLNTALAVQFKCFDTHTHTHTPTHTVRERERERERVNRNTSLMVQSVQGAQSSSLVELTALGRL